MAAGNGLRYIPMWHDCYVLQLIIVVATLYLHIYDSLSIVLAQEDMSFKCADGRP